MAPILGRRKHYTGPGLHLNKFLNGMAETDVDFESMEFRRGHHDDSMSMREGIWAIHRAKGSKLFTFNKVGKLVDTSNTWSTWSTAPRASSLRILSIHQEGSTTVVTLGSRVGRGDHE